MTAINYMQRHQDIARKHLLGYVCIGLLLALVGCGGGNSGSNPGNPEVTPAVYNFDAVDARLKQFLDESPINDGVSMILVDAEQGVVHEVALGDQSLDTVVRLASLSKMAVVSLLMALNEDESLNYDIEAPIENYLPWDGVYGDRTTMDLVSNTSGIPGIRAVDTYGPHLCQYLTASTLEACAEDIYTFELPGTIPPGTKFLYGGSQWQLAGAVAEHVTNSSWAQAFEKYIAGPCGLEVFEFGNMTLIGAEWNGSPDSLRGQANPSIEAGAISNLHDYAKLLLMHLREGRCGDTQVLSKESVALMQVNRAGDIGANYGMGWYMNPGDETKSKIVYVRGQFGSTAWLDMERGIGGFVAIDDYFSDPRSHDETIWVMVTQQIIPLQQQAVDAARAAVGGT